MIDVTTTEAHTVEGEFLTVNIILWRRYKRLIPGLVEATLDINPGLAEQGPYITQGTVILIPTLPPAQVQNRPVIRLWD